MKITKFIKNKKKYKTDYDIWIMGEITNLTKDQDNGLIELNKWLEDEKDLAISLTGSAGTGKTTLIKRFITDNSLYSKSICVAAPTHKAKEVISIITGIKSCATVQELIGLKVNYDIEEFDINQVNFLTDFSKIKIGNYELIFIDEASMINADLFNHIMKFSKMYHTKLLFIGDAYQINPVKEIISPVFNDIRQVVLYEIIRQKSTNPISELINLAREAVKYADDRLINFCLKHVDNDMFLTTGYNIFSDAQHTFDKFIDVYVENPDTFFIHYTNDVVVAWNKVIRKNLIQELEPYTIYDKIVGYNTIADKDKNYILQNSIVYGITDIDHKHVILYDLQIDYYLLTIVNKGNYSKINVVKEHSLENYRRIAYHMIQQSLKQRNWKTYYNFKDTYLLDRKLEIQKGQFTDKSIDYSYCITCHKSQGSTYDNVFINMKNIIRNKNIRERNRLIYVALSRAAYGITILI